MAFASQALAQTGWGVALAPVSASACQDGFLHNRVSSGTEPWGPRTGITCANSLPSTSESSFYPQKQRVPLSGQRRVEHSQRKTTVSRTSAAVREAAIDIAIDPVLAAAALEVAYLEPSFGLDDVLAMSGELEVVGPPPDWNREAGHAIESSGRVSLLTDAPGVEELDSVRRGLDDVFELSGDLDILGPSPDDTSGFASVDQEHGLVWPQIAEGVARRSEGFLDLSPEQSVASTIDLETTNKLVARQIGVGRLGAATVGEGSHPTKRKLTAKAMSAHFVNSSITVCAKKGAKKVIRRKASQAAVAKPSRETGDGLIDAPALREIYREGVLNIGSRVGGNVPVQKDGLGFIHQWNLLTAEEEKKLGLVIQRSKVLRNVKAELEASTGGPISEEQWAGGAGISVGALEHQVAAGNHAVQRLVECNLRLVMFVAHSMKNTANALPLEDLFLAGIQGLLSAADRFDPAFGYRFSSYVVRVIRTHVRRSIQKSGALISLPRHRTNALLNLDKVRRELSFKLGRSPTTEEIAAHKNVSVRLVNDVLRWNRGMDVTFHDFSDEKYSPQVAGSDGGLFAKDEEFLKWDLEQCISTLPEKEGEVLRRRYGLGGRPSMSLREIGDELGLSYEMVRRYEARAMLLMRKAQRMERLMQYRPMLGTA